MRHYILHIGDGKHFNSSSIKNIWGINSSHSFSKSFILNVKEGDILWFVISKSKGKLVAVSTFTKLNKRILGPLINISHTNEELGWTEINGKWDIEIHYKNLYNISECELYSEIKGACGIRKYNDKCKINLPIEYNNIILFRK